jgi:hypothetical protein
MKRRVIRFISPWAFTASECLLLRDETRALGLEFSPKLLDSTLKDGSVLQLHLVFKTRRHKGSKSTLHNRYSKPVIGVTEYKWAAIAEEVCMFLRCVYVNLVCAVVFM